jgi:hypothetical protein
MSWVNQATRKSGAWGGGQAWQVSKVALKAGANSIIVSAIDTGFNTGSDRIVITPDTVKPKVTITSPTLATKFSTTGGLLTLGGTASDNYALSHLRWVNQRTGANGTCNGAMSWTASDIVLQPGANVLVVTAYDMVGNAATDKLTVNFITNMPYRTAPAAVPGRIEVENFDLGGRNVAYFDLTTANEGKAYRTKDSVGIAKSKAASNGHLVRWTKSGEWMKYTVNVAEGGSYVVDARVASLGQGGTFRIEFTKDGVTTATDSLTVPSTGGWDWWTTVSARVNLPAGRQEMRIVMEAVGASGDVGSFDFVQLARNRSPVIEMTGAPVPAGYPTGLVQFSLSVSDPDGDECGLEVQYSIDHGASWMPALIHSAAGSLGGVTVDNGAVPQITAIATKTGSVPGVNLMQVIWDSLNSSPSITYFPGVLVRARAFDGSTWGNWAMSSAFVVDNGELLTSSVGLDPDGDEDQDGVSNADEEVAGTDPYDAESFFRFDIRHDDATGKAVVGWPFAEGREYKISWTTSLVGENGDGPKWNTLTIPESAISIDASTGVATWINDALDDTQQTVFYRMSVTVTR